MKKVLLIGLSIVLFSILFMMLRNDKEGTLKLQIKENSFFEGLKVFRKKDGIIVWTLNAKKADFKEGEDKAELTDIKMVIPKNGLVLYADKGVYNFSDQSFTTGGVVKAETKDYTITADSIDYDASSGKIKTDGFVKVEGKRFKVEGKGMKANESQKVSILKDVKATFNK